MKNKYNILLVEDNPDDAYLLGEILQGNPVYQYDLTTVESLGKAIDYLEQQTTDVILLDLSLPDSSGIDTVIRAHDNWPLIPIIIMTGLADENLAMQAMQEGAQDYLVKGETDGRQLTKAIQYAIERHRLLIDLKKSRDEQQELEAALASQQTMMGWQKGAVSAHMAGIGPLHEREPEVFTRLQKDYEELLDTYLESFHFQQPLPRREISRLSHRIGDQAAGPRDVIELHLRAIHAKSRNGNPKKVQAYTIDGRLLALEVMGYLVDYYREGLQ